MSQNQEYVNGQCPYERRSSGVRAPSSAGLPRRTSIVPASLQLLAITIIINLVVYTYVHPGLLGIFLQPYLKRGMILPLASSKSNTGKNDYSPSTISPLDV